jgi:hypothetical protein
MRWVCETDFFISVADPDPGCGIRRFFPPGSGIRMEKIGINISDHISEELINIFWVKNI